MIFHKCNLAMSHLLSWSGFQCESQPWFMLVLLHSFTQRWPESIEGQWSDAGSQKWHLSLTQEGADFEKRCWNVAHEGERGTDSPIRTGLKWHVFNMTCFFYLTWRPIRHWVGLLIQSGTQRLLCSNKRGDVAPFVVARQWSQSQLSLTFVLK